MSEEFPHWRVIGDQLSINATEPFWKGHLSNGLIGNKNENLGNGLIIFRITPPKKIKRGGCPAWCDSIVGKTYVFGSFGPRTILKVERVRKTEEKRRHRLYTRVF